MTPKRKKSKTAGVEEMRRSWRVIALAVGLLALLQALHPHLPGWRDWFKNSRLFTYYLKTQPEDLDSVKPEDELMRFDDGAARQAVDRLFEQLRHCPVRGLRAAHFGDSLIEGDLITRTLREKWQERFGGDGIGFVPITYPSAVFRRTLHHRFSKNWKRFTVLEKDGQQGGVGLTGDYSIASGDPDEPHWVRLKPPLSRFARALKPAYLYYGRISGTAKASKSKVSIWTSPWKSRASLRQQRVVTLNGRSLVNRVPITRGGEGVLELRFEIDPRLPVFGVSFEDGPGVYVDSVSLRGSAGIELKYFDTKVLGAFNELHPYDLVVLQFGMNAVDARNKHYRWYVPQLERSLDHLRQAFPGALFVVVSVADKGFSDHGSIITDPSVPLLIGAQRRWAAQTGSLFVDLFDCMGGDGTMRDWASRKPPLANTDYTHVNRRGARVLGAMLAEMIAPPPPREALVEAAP